MKRTTETVMIILGSLAFAGIASAQLSWEAATTMASDTDVATNGVYFDAGTYYSTVTLVNSVLFNPINVYVGVGAYKDGSGDLSISQTSGPIPPGGSYLAYAGGSANYKNIVSTFVYHLIAYPSIQVQLSNLTIGDQYQVQLWAYDGKNSDLVQTTLSGSPSVTLNPVLGQFAIGDFTASSSTLTFTAPAASGQSYDLISTVSVRDITPVPEPNTLLTLVSGFGILACLRRRSIVK